MKITLQAIRFNCAGNQTSRQHKKREAAFMVQVKINDESTLPGYELPTCASVCQLVRVIMCRCFANFFFMPIKAATTQLYRPGEVLVGGVGKARMACGIHFYHKSCQSNGDDVGVPANVKILQQTYIKIHFLQETCIKLKNKYRIERCCVSVE